MFRISTWIFALMLAGCIAQENAQATTIVLADAGRATPVADKDKCWRPNTKRVFIYEVDDLLAKLINANRGIARSIDDAADSPKSLKVGNFCLISIDPNSGHILCSADVSMTYKMRHHGTITVHQYAVQYEIKQMETGEKVVLGLDNLKPFIEDFDEKMEKVSTDADDERQGR